MKTSYATTKRRLARRPQLERETPIAALAVARTVLEEASLRLGRPLPNRLAARLAHQARRYTPTTQVSAAASAPPATPAATPSTPSCTTG